MGQRPFDIRDLDQLVALASPVRQQIVDVVCGLGRCSIAEIAAALGRPADGLYYHVRALLDVGLLVEAGERETQRRAETLYDVPTRGIMRLVYEPEDEANAQAIKKIVAAMLRMTERDFVAGFDEAARVSGPERNLNASRQTAWLGRDARQEVNRLLARLQEIFSTASVPSEEDGELQSLTFVMAPLEAKPVRRGT